jgi:hypothetical protein
MSTRPADPEPLAFVLDGDERGVDLRAPGVVRRAGRRMVQLVDLWVASLLPGDLLDLDFELVALGPDGDEIRTRLDALTFTRGLVALCTRQLWWPEDARAHLPHGLVLRAVVVRRVPRPSPEEAPRPATTPARPAPSATILARVLPIARTPYPPVVLRAAPRDATATAAVARSPLHAYLLALGLLATG